MDAAYRQRCLHAGYLTQASAALGFRWGRIATPWWSFIPESADYMSGPLPAVGGASGAREFYLWGGVKASLRAYNAFLQGQFRDSDLEYPYRDLRPVIGHAWMGVTLQATRHTRFAFALRYQSSELRDEGGDRDPFWGALMLQRSL